MEAIRQIEEQIRNLESSADPATRSAVEELVRGILEYHGEGLRRIVELVRESGGEGMVRQFTRDDLIASLLLLYGLHPDDFETRVRRAVDAIPQVELAGVTDFTVRVRALSSGGASRPAIEQAIYAAAPETAGVEIEGLAEPSFVPVEALLRPEPVP